jgi:hypothetical protein
MKSDTIFRVFVAVLLIGQLLYFIFPWQSLYSEGSSAALLFYGADSVLEESVLGIIGYAILALYVVTYVGLYFFMRWARQVLLALALLGGLWIPMYGVAVQSGYESMVSYLLSLGDGFLIGVAFYSKVGQRFAKI